ncbi:hypothetical protein J421_2598 [Gemmatirosa kalamazoonensis]|uniref:Uncharacterized protein n=1 Tax=Gemmatirosa kalamazoonensis TaxID=861299 RepID=W0RIG5_9BACT|nr:hypothetical protein [Gemmatirosa kalamazoonensis]AHG90135.1 hypothetical protein J421_2598 [Gemmatirosa kalamazoonensis]
MPTQSNDDSFGRGVEVTTRGGVQVITSPDGRSTTITDRGRVTTVTTTPEGKVTVTVNGRPVVDPRALNDAITRVASTSQSGRDAMVKINGRPLQEDDLLVLGAVGGAVAASLAALMLYIVLHTMGRMFRRATTRRTDDAPRLQRIEQTVESIALEVERAAEAQRYSAMLLTERLPDPPARVAGPTRAEAGGRVLTPH